MCAHVCFHQDPFASAVNLTDKPAAPSLQQYPPINHLSKQEAPSSSPPALRERSVVVPRIPDITGAVPTSCQRSAEGMHGHRGGTFQDGGWVASPWVLLSCREVMTGVSAVHANVHVCLFVRLRGMRCDEWRGACL